MNKAILAAAMAMASFGMRGPGLGYVPEEKVPRKCLLPDCTKTTTHNGGYCCAEHCKIHRDWTRIIDGVPKPNRKWRRAQRQSKNH